MNESIRIDAEKLPKFFTIDAEFKLGYLVAETQLSPAQMQLSCVLIIRNSGKWQILWIFTPISDFFGCYAKVKINIFVGYIM